MRVLMMLPLLATLLGGPDPEPLPLDHLDLGMGPRPTLQCGGRKRMEKWDREREVRLDERANKSLSRFAHGLGARLGSGEFEGRRGAWATARATWGSCVDRLQPKDAVCVAAASRRPELCAYAPREDASGRCAELAAAARALERGGPPVAVDGELTPETCARGGLLLGAIPGAPERCDGALWREAIRTNDPGWCDALADPSRRRGCLAVYTASPDLCPAPGKGAHGVLMDRDCRNETLDPGWAAEVIPEGDGGARVRFSVLNAFTTSGRCVARVAVGQDVAMTGTFSLVPAEAAETVAVTPVEVALSRSPGGLDVNVDVTCTWALDEPGHGKELGVMGWVAW